jgi:dipeptidase E
MNLLLFSNSTNFGENYFEFPLPYINTFLNGKSFKCLFIPYAGVTLSWDDYEQKVKEKFSSLGHELNSVHKSSNALRALEEAQVIVIGGGNTFNLLYHLQQNNLIDAIRDKVKSGTPYIGWSAGSNVICPTICTTNDMPVIQPSSFNALNIIPFQINPHYTEGVIPNHGGESRDARLLEYLEINRNSKVIGLREGSLILCINGNAQLLGKSAKIFRFGSAVDEIQPGASLSFLF